MATTKAQRKLFFNLRSQKKRLAWLNNEEVHRVAESLGVEPREVREMESRLTGQDMAFDPAAEADDDSAFQSPANYLEDHRYDPARQLEDADWSENSNSNLHEALEVLDERSATFSTSAGWRKRKPRCTTWRRSTTFRPSVSASWKRVR